MLNQFDHHLTLRGIVPLQNNCIYSHANPLQWQNGQYRFVNNLNFVTSRDILYSATCKYMEKVTFNTSGNNFAIAIGYNPASNSNTTIDKTNYLISSHFFNQGYNALRNSIRKNSFSSSALYFFNAVRNFRIATVISFTPTPALRAAIAKFATMTQSSSAALS